MRRSDRLYEVIQILRDGQLHRAQDMADRLGVSLRTLYRDMDTLATSGVPVQGERGVGYMITAAITLPPLNLTKVELEALHVGMALVGHAGDDELKTAALSLSAKVDAVLPEDRSAPPTGWGFAVYPFADAAKGFQHMSTLRKAVRARQKVEIAYRELDDTTTTCVIRAIELEYWGRVWTVTAWCELQGDFRAFRVDRIEGLRTLPAVFVAEKGKTLADFKARTAQETLSPSKG